MKDRYEWETTYASIQQEHGCPYCAGQAGKTIGDYRELAEEREFGWVGEELPKNVSTKTLWRCSAGHEWEARYNTIQQGSGCPRCAGKMRITLEDYRAVGKDKKIKWVGEVLPKNAKIKTRWRCSRGHEWGARYSSIQQGQGCPHCAGKAPKTAKDYHGVGKSGGIEWIGEELPKNNQTKTLWRCSKKHEWETRYSSIQQEHGCPYCAKRTIEDYHVVGKDGKIEWAGEKLPGDVHTKTLWRCSKKHEWAATYGKIQQGRGCPHCLDMVNGARVSIPQRRACEMLGGMLNYPCGSYRIDIALPDKKIAVEYDSWYWHGDRQEYDAKRDTFLLVQGWKILRIKTSRDMPSRWELDEAITKLENGEKVAEIILDDWGRGPTFADVLTREKIDPWEKGPVPISWDGGMNFSQYTQLGLW